jgi:HSP20 family protein
MTVVRYEPWALLEPLHREFDQTFETRPAMRPGAGGRYPRGSAALHRARRSAGREARRHRSDRRQGRADAARRPPVEQREVDGHYSRVERVSGKFVRTFTLPENVQTDAIKAQFKDGVLELTIPKIAKAEPRRIEIQAA